MWGDLKLRSAYKRNAILVPWALAKANDTSMTLQNLNNVYVCNV